MHVSERDFLKECIKQSSLKTIFVPVPRQNLAFHKHNGEDPIAFVFSCNTGRSSICKCSLNKITTFVDNFVRKAFLCVDYNHALTNQIISAPFVQFVCVLSLNMRTVSVCKCSFIEHEDSCSL